MDKPEAAWMRKRYNIVLIVVLGLFLRLLAIQNLSLFGDEFSSLLEARHLGMNWNGILYYSVLHFWMKIVHADWWYRLFSVLLGVSAIPFLYFAGKFYRGTRLGVAMALLGALSPFLIVHSQTVRHYIVAFLLASIALAALLAILDGNQKPIWKFWFIASLILLPFSFILGVLLSLLFLIVLYIERSKESRQKTIRIIIVSVLFLVFNLVLLINPVRIWGWHWIQHLTDAVRYIDFQNSRGFGISQLVKLPFYFFLFVLGYHVYPLEWAIVLPAAIVTAIALCVGLLRMKNKCQLILVGAFLLMLQFLVFDAVVPPHSLTLGPEYLIIFWPMLILLLADGAIGYWKNGAFMGLMLIFFTGVLYQHYSNWSYGEENRIDWPRVLQRYQSVDTDSTLLLYDGRSAQALRHYSSSSIQQMGTWQVTAGAVDSLSNFYRKIFWLSNDWQTDRIRRFNDLFRRLYETYDLVDGRVDYPLFQYSFEKRPFAGTGVPVDSTSGRVMIPNFLYGLDLSDLPLPISASLESVKVPVLGNFRLPDFRGKNSIEIALARPVGAAELFIITSLVMPSNSVTAETTIGRIRLMDSEGKRFDLDLTYKKNIFSWDEPIQNSIMAEHLAFSWHKRIFFTGQHTYPGAWRDFTAKAYFSGFTLPKDLFHSIRIDYKFPVGHLYVWGIVFR
ncbi:MAG: hypothetical protein H5U38_01855 [Calditrichaeota bacterium]|nr:hypothetical protein [Calditrichota bacterium]